MNIHNFYATSMYKGGLIVSFYKKNFVLHKNIGSLISSETYFFTTQLTRAQLAHLFSIFKKLMSSPSGEL